MQKQVNQAKSSDLGDRAKIRFHRSGGLCIFHESLPFGRVIEKVKGVAAESAAAVFVGEHTVRWR